MSLKCSKCGYEPFDGDNFCRNCGEEIDSFNCDCGAEVFDEDKFCHACGAELSEAVEDVEGPSGIPEQPSQIPQQPIQQQFPPPGQSPF